MTCDEHFESSQETDAGTKSMSGFRRARDAVSQSNQRLTNYKIEKKWKTSIS